MVMIPAEPATEHAFFNAARRTSTLFVEGASDLRFWEPRVAKTCNVRAQQSKQGVLEQLEIFTASGGAERSGWSTRTGTTSGGVASRAPVRNTW